jgi:DNA repair protein RecO (recombination protein O)
MSNRVDLEPAYLLHRRAWRETSALLEVFSREHGRVGLVARGARRPRSALRAALRPFTPLLLSWSGRGELATLSGVEVCGRIVELGAGALPGGLYLNELLLRLTHRHDPHPQLFDAYRDAAAELACGDALEDALRRFEKRLLEAIGYGLLLDHDAQSGQPVVREARYAYLREQGPVSRAATAGESVEVSGATLLALAAEAPLGPREQQEAKRLMRFVLRGHLGERPLATRSLFRVLDA